jgi:integrase/recombinase XerD
VPLSPKIVELLRDYYREYSPKTLLFEGQEKNEQYSTRSLEEVFKKVLN